MAWVGIRVGHQSHPSRWMAQRREETQQYTVVQMLAGSRQMVVDLCGIRLPGVVHDREISKHENSNTQDELEPETMVEMKIKMIKIDKRQEVASSAVTLAWGREP